MEFISGLIQSGTGYLVPFFLLIGLVVFVHEMGHFLVAKLCNVGVEVFSLGFGPYLVSFRFKETTYAISLIPLGGYVKMLGSEDEGVSQSSGENYEALQTRPLYQRMAIVLAGPLMNFIFAVVLFFVIARLGEEVLYPYVGDVEPGSQAEAMGFLGGEKILDINEKKVESWQDVQNHLRYKADQSVVFRVKRNSETVELSGVVQDLPNSNPFEWRRTVGGIEGLSVSSRASIVGIADPNSLASQAGLETGDIVQSINGQKVNSWRELVQVLNNVSDGELFLEFERGFIDQTLNQKKPEGESQDLLNAQINLSNLEGWQNLKGEERPQRLGMEFSELFLLEVVEGTPAEDAGLKAGDRIVSVNDRKVSTFQEVTEEIRSLSDLEAESIQVTVIRSGEYYDFSIVPRYVTRMTMAGQEETRPEIGVRSLYVTAKLASFVKPSESWIQAAHEGWDKSVYWSQAILVALGRIFKNELSPKNLGTVLSIGQAAHQSWELGVAAFLSIMAIISINLFIFNLLPLPILDGGQFFLYLIEAIKGSPVSPNKVAVINQIGFFLLIGLILFALFNDVNRLFFS